MPSLDASSAVGRKIGKVRYGRVSLETLVLVAACSVIALVFPLPYDRSILTLTIVYGIAGIGINIVTGFAGIISVGHGLFLAIGAYTWARLAPHSQSFAVTAALVIALCAAAAIGWGFLRLRGYFLTIATLAVGQGTFVIARIWTGVTGGNNGITGIDSMHLGGLGAPTAVLAVSVIALAVAFWLHAITAQTPVGLAMFAVRGNEEAAAASGIRVRLTRTIAFAASAVPVAFAGVMLAQATGYVSPDGFTIITSVNLMAIAVIGGRGWRWAPLVGAVIVIALPEYARFAGAFRLIFYAAVLTSIALFAPGGVRQILQAAIAAIRRVHLSNWRARPRDTESDLVDAGGSDGP